MVVKVSKVGLTITTCSPLPIRVLTLVMEVWVAACSPLPLCVLTLSEVGWEFKASKIEKVGVDLPIDQVKCFFLYVARNLMVII